MRSVMQSQSFALVVAGGNLHMRPQYHASELSRAVGSFFHHAGSCILIFDHADVVDRAQMQIPKHVAGGQAGDQKLLRVVACGVAAKVGIAGTGDVRLSCSTDDVIAAVTFISTGALTIIPGPVHSDFVGVLFHRALLAGDGSADGFSCETLSAG